MKVQSKYFISRLCGHSSLFVASPVIYFISWVYVFPLNIGIALYLLTNNVATNEPLLGAGIAYSLWGVLFLALGLWQAVGLITDRWQSVYHSMVAGLFTKLFWTLALIYGTTIYGFAKLSLTLIWWLSVALIQLIIVAHFPAKKEVSHDSDILRG